jgi:glycosyltransferase involved in cell wall biosynthesis
LGINKEYDILLSGISKEKHYPLKYRLFNLINKHKNTTLSKYKIYVHNHPGYNNELSFQNINQIKYNEIINKSKLCVSCTSRYKYRLGKYVEIPMGGSVILGDLPFEDEKFKDFVIEVNMEMSDQEILNKIIFILDNPDLIEQKIKIGLEWSKKYITKTYTDNLLKIINNNKKIFIISDEIKDDHPEFKNQKWICDILKQEFMEKFPFDTTNNAKEANIIWYLAPWNYRHVPNGFKANEWFDVLKKKKVIFTQHHIDEEKLKAGQLDKQFEFMKTYGNKFHTICEITKKEMMKYFDNKLISSKRLWINDKNFYNIPNKSNLRIKYGFSENAYLIGSFQKDTEGKTNLPKLSKGPDIFVNIAKDIYLTKPNLEVILTGLRREYIITELEKAGIKYHYFNMATIEQLNEFYNCLDLYIISSRCEGGPRAVVEAGITKTPIISTRVGIAPELMARSSLFDYNNWINYKLSKPNIDLLYNNVSKLTSQNYIEEFLIYLKK